MVLSDQRLPSLGNNHHNNLERKCQNSYQRNYVIGCFFTLCRIGTVGSTGTELVKMPAKKRVLALTLPMDRTRLGWKKHSRVNIIDVVKRDVVVPAVIDKPLLQAARDECVHLNIRRNEACSRQGQCPQGEEL